MKLKILENVFTTFQYGSQTYYIYVNPKSNELNSKEDTKENRGIIDTEGNLYMEAKWIGDVEDDYEKYSNIIHDHVVKFLQEKGKFLELDNQWWKEGSDSIKYAVFVQRADDSNEFYLAESYESELLLDEDLVEEFFIKAEKKNPHLVFYFKSIMGGTQ